MIKEKFKIERKEKREKEKEKARDEQRLRVNSNFCDCIIGKGSKHVYREKECLEFIETAMITRMRTEHIELNLYKYVIFGIGDGNCDLCECYETVRHFLCDCKKYDQERKILRDELLKYNKIYKHKQFFNAKRILFPHLNQREKKKQWNVDKRVMILKNVCLYMAMTRRFENENSKSGKIYKRYVVDDKLKNVEMKCKNIIKKYDKIESEMIIEEREQNSNEKFNINSEIFDYGEQFSDSFIDEIIHSQKQFEYERMLDENVVVGS